MGRVIRKLSEPDDEVLIGNPGTTDDPAPTETGTWPASSQYDISRYTVQAWSGSAWQTVASVSGNTKHIVRLAFAPVTTDRIRVIPADDASNGQTANDNLVSLTEIEVRSPAGAGQIRTQRFDAWGKLEQAAGSVPTYGYTGREPDATGLIHYRARYYHPELGRFVSRDPLGLAAGINPYAYVDGNPVLFNDPDGLLAKQAWNSVTEPFTQARALADKTKDDAKWIALTMSGGDNKAATNLLWNGQVDAWRHAEWNRRMASDPKIGSFLAGIIGTGHELENFVQKITEGGVPDQTWSQFYRESLMDMKNNRTGRELAREGALFTDVNDPRLYFGSGGKFGQPTGAPYNAEKIGEVEVMGP